MKRAAYDFIPILNRNVFFGTDVDAIAKLVLQYFKPEDIDIEHFKANEKVYGLVCAITSTKVEDVELGYIVLIRDPKDHNTIAHEITPLKIVTGKLSHSP